MLLNEQKRTSKTIYPDFDLALNQESTWVEVSKSAIENNINQYKKVAPHSFLAPVIKSNAYGHGIENVGIVCQNHPAVHMICVVSVTEALLLRSQGIKKPLLVLSILNDDLEKAIINDIQLVVHDIETVAFLNSLAQKNNKKAHIHIKVDTGLSRLGVPLDFAASFFDAIKKYDHIQISGIFSHFADSESQDQTFTLQQINAFNHLLFYLESQNIFIPYKHISCSAAASAQEKSHFNFIRVGIGIYGLWPSLDNQKMTQEKYPEFNLVPAMTWKTKIIQIKKIPQGSFVGYDRTHQVVKTTTMAVLPVGYWDGYDRELSNKGHVLVAGKLARVLGRIAMNLCMIDVTDIESVKVGHEIILLGNYPGVCAQTLADLCNTINYEIVARINPLIKRIIR